MNPFNKDNMPITGNRSNKDSQPHVASVNIGGHEMGVSKPSTNGFAQGGMNAAQYVGDGAGKGMTHMKDGTTTGLHHMKDGAASGYTALADAPSSGLGMDTSFVMKLDEAKNMFNAEFNSYLTLDFSKFMDIIPVDFYGPITKMLLNFFLFLPGFFSFYTIKMFHDSIFTIIFLSIFIFAGLTFVHYNSMDEKIWYFIALKNFNLDYKARIKSAVILGVSVGIALGTVLILYFTFVPFGPNVIALQMPYKQNYYDLLYWVVFSVFFLTALPVTEVLFFVIFQSNVWFRASAQIKIASFYAFYHFGWLCEVVGNWWAIGTLTALSFFVCLFLIKLMGREDVFKCITVRVGINVGVWALLVYLYFQTPKGKTAIPHTFLRGSENNLFMKS